jgi:nicotinamidase-related amidase
MNATTWLLLRILVATEGATVAAVKWTAFGVHNVGFRVVAPADGARSVVVKAP